MKDFGGFWGLREFRGFEVLWRRGFIRAFHVQGMRVQVSGLISGVPRPSKGDRFWVTLVSNHKTRRIGFLEGHTRPLFSGTCLLKQPKGLSTYMVECRVSMLGITIMIWGSVPHRTLWERQAIKD